MTEQRIPLTEEEQIRRNKLLRRKKFGIQFAFLILMVAACGAIYLLQVYEHIEGQTLYITTAVMTLILVGAFLMYSRFARLINLDMQSNEKIVTTGIVVRTNFIGNRVYPTRIYGSDGQKYITLDVNGRWMTLSGIQLKRLVPEVWQTNRIYLRDEFLMEFTPYGRHLMRIDRLT